jgi:hypothetical protein
MDCSDGGLDNANDAADKVVVAVGEEMALASL